MSAWPQVLGWLQPSLTRQFLGLAFHPKTHMRCPELLCQEANYSNANPPHMFRAFYRQVRLGICCLRLLHGPKSCAHRKGVPQCK